MWDVLQTLLVYFPCICQPEVCKSDIYTVNCGKVCKSDIYTVNYGKVCKSDIYTVNCGKVCKSDIYTVNCGMAYGQAAMLLSQGAKGFVQYSQILPLSYICLPDQNYDEMLAQSKAMRGAGAGLQAQLLLGLGDCKRYYQYRITLYQTTLIIKFLLPSLIQKLKHVLQNNN